LSQRAMNEDELREFLSQPLIADIVTLRKDGSPQITPVLYYFDGTYLYISTTTTRAKGRNIKRDNRIAVSIRNQDASKVVLFSGKADILDDKNHSLLRRIAAKYTPPAKIDGLLSGIEPDRVIIRLNPSRSISWTRNVAG